MEDGFEFGGGGDAEGMVGDAAGDLGVGGFQRVEDLGEECAGRGGETGVALRIAFDDAVSDEGVEEAVGEGGDYL